MDSRKPQQDNTLSRIGILRSRQDHRPARHRIQDNRLYRRLSPRQSDPPASPRRTLRIPRSIRVLHGSIPPVWRTSQAHIANRPRHDAHLHGTHALHRVDGYDARLRVFRRRRPSHTMADLCQEHPHTALCHHARTMATSPSPAHQHHQPVDCRHVFVDIRPHIGHIYHLHDTTDRLPAIPHRRRPQAQNHMGRRRHPARYHRPPDLRATHISRPHRQHHQQSGVEISDNIPTSHPSRRRSDGSPCRAYRLLRRARIYARMPDPERRLRHRAMARDDRSRISVLHRRRSCPQDHGSQQPRAHHARRSRDKREMGSHSAPRSPRPHRPGPRHRPHRRARHSQPRTPLTATVVYTATHRHISRRQNTCRSTILPKQQR